MNTMIARYHAFAPIAIAFCFISLCPFTARADTPTQTQRAIQAVLNRAAISYQRRDLSGVMAMYSSGSTITNVTGKKFAYQQTRALLAKAFHKSNYNSVVQCTVTRVTALGNVASVVLRWRSADRYASSTSAPSYLYTRNLYEDTIWKKTAGRWLQTSADMRQDVIEYRR